MKATALLQAGVLALTSSFLAANASAAVINVENASFEDQGPGGLPNACGTDCFYSLDFIPGWINNPSESGQFQPGVPATLTYFDSLSDGPTSAFGTSTPIMQIVAPTVQLGVVYTLLVDIGARKDLPATGTAALLVNGVQYAATGSFLPGGFATFTATYTGLPGDVGQQIAILLMSSGSQGNFDNVRLSDDTVGPVVPEPGTMALLGLGFTALGLLRRKLAA